MHAHHMWIGAVQATSDCGMVRLAKAAAGARGPCLQLQASIMSQHFSGNWRYKRHHILPNRPERQPAQMTSVLTPPTNNSKQTTGTHSTSVIELDVLAHRKRTLAAAAHNGSRIRGPEQRLADSHVTVRGLVTPSAPKKTPLSGPALGTASKGRERTLATVAHDSGQLGVHELRMELHLARLPPDHGHSDQQQHRRLPPHTRSQLAVRWARFCERAMAYMQQAWKPAQDS